MTEDTSAIEAELLGAIWREPHEDPPRLVYADHLQRGGDPPLGEFIQLQCSLAAMVADDPQREAVERRARHLWTAFHTAFRRGLDQRLRDSEFERGFAVPVLSGVTPHKLWKVFHELLGQVPSCELEVVGASRGDLSRLCLSPALERISRLALRNARGGFDALAQSPHARNLVALDWEYSFASTGVVAQVLEWPHLASLRLGSCDLSVDPGRLAEVPGAGRLRELDLRSSKLGVEGIVALFGGGRFSRLESLDLSYNTPGDGLVEALVTRCSFPKLSRLRLYGMGLTPRAAEALAAWSGPLRHLDLDGNIELRAAGVRAVLRLPTLESLAVFPTRVEHAQIEALLRERFGTVRENRYALRGLRVES